MEWFKNLNNKLSKLRINTIIHCATHYVKKHAFDDIQKLNISNILIYKHNLKLYSVIGKLKVKKYPINPKNSNFDIEKLLEC